MINTWAKNVNPKTLSDDESLIEHLLSTLGLICAHR